MFLVFTIKPSAEHACRHRIEQSLFSYGHHQCLVFFGQHIAGSLSKISVAYRKLTRHDVGQCVNENSRTWEIVICTLYRMLIVLVIAE